MGAGRWEHWKRAARGGSVASHEQPSGPDAESWRVRVWAGRRVCPRRVPRPQSTPLDFKVGSGRQAYLLCMEGAAAVSGAHGTEQLARHEAAHIRGESELHLRLAEGQGPSAQAHCLLVEMAQG